MEKIYTTAKIREAINGVKVFSQNEIAKDDDKIFEALALLSNQERNIAQNLMQNESPPVLVIEHISKSLAYHKAISVIAEIKKYKSQEYKTIQKERKENDISL